MRTIIAAAALLALSACAAEDNSDVAQASSWAVAAANPVGPPVDCIERSRIRGTAVRDARTLDFQLDDGRLLRNRLSNACEGLPTSRFIYRTGLDRLCSTDTITLLQPDGRAGGSCGLGRFQPIAIPPRQGRIGRN